MLTRSGGQPADELHSRQFPEFSSAMHVDNAPKIYHISKRNKLVACLRKTCTGENLFFPFFFPSLFNETMAYSQRQVSFNALVKCCNDAGTYEINEQNTCTVVMVERCKQIFEVTWCEMTLCEISEHGENRKICDWMIISPLLQSLSLFFRVTKKRSTEWANTELSNVRMKARYKVDLLPNAFLRLGVFQSS